MRWIAFISISILLVACLGTSQASGSVTKVELGTTATALVDDCVKVGDPNTPGVELLRAGKIIIRVVPDDLLGASIVVAGKQVGQPEELTQSACSTWEFDTHFNGNSVDYDPEIDGSLDAVCTLPNGGTLEAHATFANCL